MTTRPVVEVVGLGPGGDEYLTTHTLERIAAHRHRFVRTLRHPSAHVMASARSFDDVYDRRSTFDEVYAEIVDTLIAAARSTGRILYAVPGSPLVLERTVHELLRHDDLEVVVNPAMSFLDLVWSRLRIDPIDAGVTLVDGHEFATRAAGESGPLLVAHCHANWVLSDVKLAADDTVDASNDDVEVVLLHHLGLPDEVVVTTRWAEIDRTLEADHLTSLFVPRLAAPVGRELVAFHELARTLRRECPWDREQTHRSLVTYLLEETHEVVDALLALDPDDPSTDEHLVEELGDLLYQIEFHAAIGEQQGRFTMADVARGINDKLVRRHPHVFAADADRWADATTDRLTEQWDAIKRAEKGDHPSGPFDSIPSTAGALSYAAAVLKKAERAGRPIRIAEPLGFDGVQDLAEHLLGIVAEFRRRDLDPEVELRDLANRRRHEVEVLLANLEP